MTDYVLTCENCQNILSFPDEMLNQLIKCPACNEKLQLTSPPATIDTTQVKNSFDGKKTVFEKRVDIPLVNKTEIIRLDSSEIESLTEDEVDKNIVTKEVKGGLWNTITKLFGK